MAMDHTTDIADGHRLQAGAVWGAVALAGSVEADSTAAEASPAEDFPAGEGASAEAARAEDSKRKPASRPKRSVVPAFPLGGGQQKMI